MYQNGYIGYYRVYAPVTQVVTLPVWLKPCTKFASVISLLTVNIFGWYCTFADKGLPAVKRIGSRGSSEVTRSLLNLEEVHVPDLSPLERRPIETTGVCSGKAERVFARDQGFEPIG